MREIEMYHYQNARLRSFLAGVQAECSGLVL
jgi:hypothetical protein